ncbi:MAG: class II aldolase/adducin family protein [Deltaproteobacteria bacterium]|nr:class II aldolase/adducin family protein [Deltaproteobacteria bacterium]
MSEQYIIGLDIGGGSGRCLLVEVESKQIFSTSRTWTHPIAPGTGGFGFNLDLNDIWRKIGMITREALTKADVSPDKVLGISTTSMRHGVVVIDKDGKALMTFANKDARAAMEAFTLAADHGQKLYDRTGHWPCPVFAASHLTYMANNAPDVLEKASAILSISDWAGYCLTGVVAAEPSQAGETMLLDLESRDWADDLIAELKFPRDIFPKVMSAGERLGTLTKEAAKHLGLQAGTPVAIGGGDTQSGLLGSGATSPGQMAAVAGTTTPVQLVVDRPIIDPEARLWTGQHIIPGMWVLESNAGSTGRMLDMLAEALYPDATSPVATLMAEATSAAPGSNGIISTLGAQVFNAKELMNVPVNSLTLSPVIADKKGGRANLCRSILEGMAYALVTNIEQIKRVGGEINELKLCGGMSRSALWSQINCDILNISVNVFEPQATALGAIICAGVGAGVFKDLSEGAKRLASPVREHKPDAETSGIYQGLNKDWSELLDVRKGFDEKAGGKIMQVVLSQTGEEETRVSASDFRPRILVTAELDEGSLGALREIGDVEYASYRERMRLLTGDDLVKALEGVHVFITEIDVVDGKALGRLPDLKLIATCRANPVNIDIKACTKLGIPVINTPGRNADAVADLTVAFILMLARRFPGAGEFLHEPGGEAGDMGRMGMAHNKFQGKELWRKTIGLVGMGAVGKKTAKRVHSFGANLLIYDPYISPEQAILAGAKKVSFETLLKQSDFICLHAPVTKETRGMINADAFAKMKQSAFLINTARSALIDNDALVAALESGKLGGAALDVFNVEPPASDDPLLNLPNVIGTPHIGGNTVEVGAHQGQIVVDELSLMLGGKKPHYVLNPDVLEGFSWTGRRKELSAEEIEELASSVAPGVSDLEVEAKKEKKEQISYSGDIRREDTQTMSAADIGPVRDNMMRLLQAYIDKIVSDETLKTFSEGKDVTMHFIITDLDLEFSIALKDGIVESALSAPPDSDVILKMKAGILDGIFTGRSEGMKAAMSGDLSFTGDTAKAMTFQNIQNDLIRLYSTAREEVGDPGDLTQIGKAPQAQQIPKQQGASQGFESTVIKVGDIRDEILEVINELYAKDLITATGGNVSARIPDKGNEIWISPSQIYKGNLRADMMVRIDLDGNPLDPDALPASSERNLHAEVYRRRPDINAIIHTHAPMATILDMANIPFAPISTEAAFIGEIKSVPFFMPGSLELANAVADAIGNKGIAAFMRNHGLVVTGTSLRRVMNMTDVIEITARALISCRSLGVDPPVLPDDIVENLREIGKMMA